MVIPGASDAGWLGGGSSNRKRVFTPGFVALSAVVAVIELILLNHFHSEQTSYGKGVLSEGWVICLRE